MSISGPSLNKTAQTVPPISFCNTDSARETYLSSKRGVIVGAYLVEVGISREVEGKVLTHTASHLIHQHSEGERERVKENAPPAITHMHMFSNNPPQQHIIFTFPNTTK